MKRSRTDRGFSISTLDKPAMKCARGGGWLSDLINGWLSGDVKDDTAIAGRTDAGVPEAADGSWNYPPQP
jgi:hypothetical protein